MKSFQHKVADWLLECFGAEIASDKEERNHRFLEEALELVQACDATQSEAHQLVDYVYGRPVGEKPQEVGGVMVTLAALCSAQGMDMHAAGETELARIWTKVEKIRAKQAAKPKNSPLPQVVDQQAQAKDEDERTAFEDWVKTSQGFGEHFDFNPLSYNGFKESEGFPFVVYGNYTAKILWEGWQARSQLARDATPARTK